MNKNLLTFFAIALLSLTLVFAATSMNKFELTNVEDSDATGTATIKVTTTTKSNLQNVRIGVKLDKLESNNDVFEGWLVDTDSGYKLSLGAFESNRAGKANFKFNQKMVNFDIYDKIVITREQIMDTNPNPGTTVLTGDIPGADMNEVSLKSWLNGSQEIPPNNSTAWGNGSFVLDKDANTLSFNIWYTGLMGNETGAHIHGFAGPGYPAGVLFTLPSGSIKAGTWHYDEAYEVNILGGLTYVNVHSNIYPDGEIRGQILVV